MTIRMEIDIFFFKVNLRNADYRPLITFLKPMHHKKMFGINLSLIHNILLTRANYLKKRLGQFPELFVPQVIHRTCGSSFEGLEADSQEGKDKSQNRQIFEEFAYFFLCQIHFFDYHLQGQFSY